MEPLIQAIMIAGFICAANSYYIDKRRGSPMVFMRDYKDLKDAFRREDVARHAQSKRDGDNGELTLEALARRMTAAEEEIRKLKNGVIRQNQIILEPKDITENSNRACYASIDATLKSLGMVQTPDECLEGCKEHGNVNACWVKQAVCRDCPDRDCVAILGGVTKPTTYKSRDNTCWIFSY